MKSIVAILVLTASVPAVQAVNPIEKVLQMVSDMQQKLIGEGEDAQKAYTKHANFCESSAQKFGFEIKTGKAQVAKLQATIESETASATALSSKIEDLSSDISSSEAELNTATGIREKEASAFSAEEKEMMTMADSLERAISVISKELNGASMLQMKNANSVTDALRVMVQAEALSSEDGSKLTALVQQSQSATDEDSDADSELGAPAAAATENQSGGILSVLEGLLDKSNEELDKARKAEAKSAQNYAMLKQSLTDEIKFGSKDMDEAKSGLAASQEAKAVAGGDLDATSKDLAGDVAAKRELHHACMTTATQFEDSVRSRDAELKALAQAKKIISEGTGGAASQSYGLAQVSLLQMSTRTQVQSARYEAVRWVKKLAQKHKSAALAQLASRMNSALRLGGDPFAKVKGLITEMLEKLAASAEEDATQKAYCDKEMAAAKDSKDEKSTDLESLTTKVSQKKAMSSKLKGEASTLQGELAGMAQSHGELTQIRQTEKATYDKNAPEMEQGLAALKQALKVLREYYGGKDSGGIIAMLEVAESDFEKGLAEMNVQEETAAAEFDEETKVMQVEKVSKEQDNKYKTKEAKGLDKAVADLSGDVTGSQEQLDAVVEYDTKIKKECVAQPEPYEERKKRREEEIAGLKQGLTILEGESFIQQSSTRKLRVARRH